MYEQQDYQAFIDKYFQKRFIILFFIIFIILCFIFSFFNFLGKWPIFIFITFILAAYVQKRMDRGY